MCRGGVGFGGTAKWASLSKIQHHRCHMVQNARIRSEMAGGGRFINVRCRRADRHKHDRPPGLVLAPLQLCLGEGGAEAEGRVMNRQVAAFFQLSPTTQITTRAILHS